MSRALLLCLLVGMGMSDGFAETIHLKDGRIVEGEILQKTDKRVKVKSVYGPVDTYRLDEIRKIEDDEPQEKRAQDPPRVPAAKETPPASSRLALQPEAVFSKPLLQQGPTATELFERVSPSVVVVTVKTPFSLSQGSGFIIGEGGLIATALHNVMTGGDVTVKLKDDRTFPVLGVRYFDAAKDLCLLDINVQDLPSLSLGDSDALKPGEPVFVIGSPLGFEYTISDGILSSLRAQPQTPLRLHPPDTLGTQQAGTFLQFTAAVSAGSSGGPLLNAQGEGIGIVILSVEQAQNLNLAVPINALKGPIHDPGPIRSLSHVVAELQQYPSSAVSETVLQQYLRSEHTVELMGTEVWEINALDSETRRLVLLGLRALREAPFGEAINYAQQAISRVRKDSAEYIVVLRLLVSAHEHVATAQGLLGAINKDRDAASARWTDIDSIRMFEKANTLIGSSKDPYLRKRLAKNYASISQTYQDYLHDRRKAQQYLEKLQRHQPRDQEIGELTRWLEGHLNQ